MVFVGRVTSGATECSLGSISGTGLQLKVSSDILAESGIELGTLGYKAND